MRSTFRSAQGPQSIDNDPRCISLYKARKIDQCARRTHDADVTFPYDTSTSLPFVYRSEKASKSPYAAGWCYQRPTPRALGRPCNENYQMEQDSAFLTDPRAIQMTGPCLRRKLLRSFLLLPLRISLYRCAQNGVAGAYWKVVEWKCLRSIWTWRGRCFVQ
jgi:hypothetical protein